MSKPNFHFDRSALPAGWNWADWKRSDETQRFWRKCEKRIVQGFRHRFMEILVGIQNGTPLPKDKVFFDKGIGKAKLKKPNPGWRGFFFQGGNQFFITHFTDRNIDHNVEIARALEAQKEHDERKKKSGSQVDKRNP